MMWFCRKDDAYVGCHNNTTRPLGVMANKELRGWRIKAHDHVDQLWKTKRLTLYRRLNDWFGKEVHIGEADIDMCRQIIAIPLDLLAPQAADR
jgi:hypothetical protein